MGDRTPREGKHVSKPERKIWLWSALLTAVSAYATWYYDATVWAFLNKNGGSFYGTITSVAGTLLGFVFTAFTIIVGYKRDPELLLAMQAGALRLALRIYRRALIWLGILTILGMAGVLTSWNWLFYPFQFLLWQCGLRVMQCLKMMEDVVAPPGVAGQPPRPQSTTVTPTAPPVPPQPTN